MDKQYFMIIDDRQCGPFTPQQLVENGLNANSIVWTNGMADWEPASEVPELSALLWEKSQEESAFGTYAQPDMSNRHRYGGNQPVSNRKPHVDWMPWAITGTILGFLFSCIGAIFGIIGIIQSNKANNAYNYGDNQTGDTANSTAKVMTVIALVLAGIGLVFSVLTLVGIFSFGTLANL